MSTGGGGGGGGGKLGSNTDTDGALLLTFAFGGRPLGRFVGDGDDDFFACLLGDEAFFFSAEDDLGRGLPLFLPLSGDFLAGVGMVPIVLFVLDDVANCFFCAQRTIIGCICVRSALRVDRV